MLEHFCRLHRFRATTAVITLALTVATLIVVTPPVHAQLFRGGLSGTVTVQPAGPMAGVDVTLTNQATDVSETRQTDADGRFQFLAIEPGRYKLEFKRTGFKPTSISNVIVRPSDETTLNQVLKLADLGTNMDVHDVAGAYISKTNPNISFSFEGQTLEDIPLGTSSFFPGGTRNMARFALFAPAVARVPGQNEFSANGHRGRENNFMLDGVGNNDNTVTLPAVFTPPEAIQEFQLQVATFSAVFGRNMGAQINIITRSGTKNFRGEVWEFYRGNALEPLSLQSRRSGLTASPKLVDNQFGGDFGGPIIQGKTFFFGLLQANRLRSPKPFGLVTIPTPTGYAALAGIPLRTASGSITAQTAASRQLMLDAIGFLPGFYPQINHFDSFTTTTVNSIPVELGAFNPLVSQDQNFLYGLARIDHNVTTNDRLTYRVHVDNRNSPLSTGNLAFGERWGADSQTLAQNHALSYTKIIGTNFVNEMRLAYSRLSPVFTERDPVSSTVTLSSLFTIGGLAGFPQARREQSYQFQNISTFIVNRHSLKFGLDHDRTHLFNNAAGNSKGTWSFNNLQDFLNNQPNQLVQLISAPSVFSFTQLKQAYFFQDDIKVSSSLTANVGLRYETASVPLGYFGATDPVVLASNVPGPGKRDTNNWGPRIGFAYSHFSKNGILGKLLGGDKSVVRGGFGVGYDVIFYNAVGTPATNYPRTNTQTTTSATLVDAFPVLTPKTNTVTFSPTATFANIPSDAQNPTTHYWSLSVQRELPAEIMMEVGYTGSRSYHLLRQGQANPGILSQAKADAVIAGCTPTLGSCQDPGAFPSSPSRLDSTLGIRTLLETSGEATYNAGYIQLNKRASFGLQVGANYTWSTNISDSEELFNDLSATDGGIAGSSPQVPQNYLNRRGEKSRSAFDRPHRFTIHESYVIPFFKSAPKFLQVILADWQASAFTEMQSGQPFSITVGVDTLGSGTATPGRPNLNPGGIMIADPITGNFRTFVIPLDGTGIVTAPHVTNTTTQAVTFLKNSMPNGGTLGRNAFRGPGYSNTNLSIMKKFKLSTDKTLEIRSDFLNLFNHDNFQNPVTNMSSTNFGKNIFVPFTDARQVLLGAKFRF